MKDDEQLEFGQPDVDGKGPSMLAGLGLSTETIDLSRLFTQELTTSGSFDIRSGIWATTFGKVLQALPIPALLIDRSHQIIVVNQACGRISTNYDGVQGAAFACLLPTSVAAGKARALLEEVFSTRRPRVAEALLEVAERKVWSRLTLRSIRIQDQRFVLVLVEDLTHERNELLLSRKREEELRYYRDQLKKRVTERTAELEELGEELREEIVRRGHVEEALRVLIGGMENKMREDRDRVSQNLELRIRPLLDQLKTEDLSERASLLVTGIETHLAGALSTFEQSISGLADKLTPSELRVCELIRSGLTTEQIAHILNVTAATVSFHRSSARKKLNLAGSDQDLTTFLRRKV